MSIKADALTAKGETASARRALEEALQSARAIGNARLRDNYVRQLTQALAEAGEKR